MIDLAYELDEIAKDVTDLEGGQEQLSKRLDRIEEGLAALLDELPYNTALATSEARRILSREL